MGTNQRASCCYGGLLWLFRLCIQTSPASSSVIHLVLSPLCHHTRQTGKFLICGPQSFLFCQRKGTCVPDKYDFIKYVHCGGVIPICGRFVTEQYFLMLSRLPRPPGQYSLTDKALKTGVVFLFLFKLIFGLCLLCLAATKQKPITRKCGWDLNEKQFDVQGIICGFYFFQQLQYKKEQKN